MGHDKKLFFFGLIIFVSLLFFSNTGKVQACNYDGICQSIMSEDSTNCPSDCGPSAAGTAICGDNSVNQQWEDCDGSDLQGLDCTDGYFGNFTGGNLSCDFGCSFDTSGCISGGGNTSGTCNDWGACNYLAVGACDYSCFAGGGAGGQCATGASLGTACTTGSGATGICSDIGVCTATSGGFPGTNTSGTQQTPTTGSIIPSASVIGLPDPQGGIVVILMNFLLWLIYIFGILAMIGFIVSGVQYLSSAGSEKMAETAKRNLTYSIIGVIVGLSGYIIIKAIQSALTATPIF